MSFPYRISASSDVELSASSAGRIKHNSSVQFLHADDALLDDLQNVELNSGDLLHFNGSNIVAKPSSDFAAASDLSNYVASADLSSALDAQSVARQSDLTGFLTSADISGLLSSADAASTYLSQASAASDYQAKADMAGYLQSADLAGYALSADVASTYQSQADMANYLQTGDLQAEVQALSGVTLTAPGFAGEVLENSGALRHGCVTVGSHVNTPVTVYDLNINGSSSAWKVHAKSTLKGQNGSICVNEKECVFALTAGAALPVSGTDTSSVRGAGDGSELQITYSTTHVFVKVQSSAANDATGAKSVIEYDIVEC